MSPGEWCPATILRGGKKKVSEQEFQRPHHNHLTSLNSEIDPPDDGNVLIARLISDALRTKIAGALLTPWRSGVPIWSAFPSDVFEFRVNFEPHR